MPFGLLSTRYKSVVVTNLAIVLYENEQFDASNPIETLVLHVHLAHSVIPMEINIPSPLTLLRSATIIQFATAALK
jgi:hypothetical protein